MERCEDFEVGGFARIERGKARAKRGDFWEGLELMSSGAGVMRGWEWAFGAAVDLVRPFLKPTGRRAMVIACPAPMPCECQHAVRETEMFGLVAACCCEDWRCDTFRLELGDVLIHALDRHAFGAPVAGTLGFVGTDGTGHQGVGMFEIGRCTAAAAPVYRGMGDSEALLREIGKVVAVREGPFVLLTPTGKACSAQVEQALRHQAAAHISLSSVLEPLPRGAFRAMEAAGPALADFVERVARSRQSGAVLSGIHREIAAVRGEFVELRSAKQRLEKMLAEGLFAFTQKVDANSFKVLCAILAEGDVAKASRSLATPEATVRAVVRRWRERGKEYRAMVDLVRWRKKVGRKEKLPLNEAIVHERAATTDYPGLLSDVLEGLLSMTEENWAERCEDLAEMLRPAVAGERGR